MHVDYCLSLDGISALLTKLANEPVKGTISPSPAKIASETEFTKMQRDINDMNELGKLSPFTCPTCQGALLGN